MTPGDGAAHGEGAVRHAAVVDRPLSVDRMIDLVSGPSIGGIACFLGIVRDHDQGRTVEGLGYTAHPQAAARLEECARDTAGRFEVEAVAAEHRVGQLAVGDLAVVVVVGARHRGPAIDACHALIDTIKEQVPIWKEQRFGDGTVEWVGL